ncbi:MAG: DUF4296 domain-containing protein [Rhodothermales bacterium]
MPFSQPTRWTLAGALSCAVFGTVLLTAGCAPGEEAPDEPPPFPDSVFVDILIDLHLASARAQHWNDIGPGMKDSVLAHYGVTREQYDAAVEFYSAHPKAYLDAYNAALDELNVERFTTDGRQ